MPGTGSPLAEARLRVEQRAVILANDAVELAIVKVAHAVVEVDAPVRAGIGEGVQAVLPSQHEAFFGQLAALERERLALAVRKSRRANDSNRRWRGRDVR